jgi:uncharacterized membrane protein
MPSLNARVVSQGGTAPISKSKSFPLDRLPDRTLAAYVIASVFFFAPMSWWYYPDDPHAPNWSDKVLAVLVSPKFAYGEGSGSLEQPPMLALIRNMATMKPHMQAGTIATIIGLAQFSSTLQFKYPVVHRSLGRAYGLCVVVLSASSAQFLWDAVPSKEVFSGEFFGLVLAVLTVAVPATMLLALQAIWNGDISSHREFMTLNYSFMLSAPSLRVSWILLALTWGQQKDVVNLFSVAIVAPILVVVPMFYLRRNYQRRANATLTDPRLRLGSAVAGLIGLIFCASQLPSFEKWSFPLATFLCLGVPAVFYVIMFMVLAERAKQRGDQASEGAWATYLNGLISSPAWAPIMFYIARDVFAVPEQHLGITTLNNAIATGLTAGFSAYVFATSKKGSK